jgi:hypothetical protein
MSTTNSTEAAENTVHVDFAREFIPIIFASFMLLSTLHSTDGMHLNEGAHSPSHRFTTNQWELSGQFK